MAWTDEKRKLVVDSYVATMKDDYETDEARANATTEVAAELAELHGETVNGVISILNRAKVYIKKSSVKKAVTATTSTRINKAEAIQTLRELIADTSVEVNEEILGKLTGKAAVYLSSVLHAALAE